MQNEVVRVPVPVVKKLDPALLRECLARYRYPADRLTVEDLTERLAAVEDALALCANQVEAIRAAQD